MIDSKRSILDFKFIGNNNILVRMRENLWSERIKRIIVTFLVQEDDPWIDDQRESNNLRMRRAQLLDLTKERPRTSGGFPM